VPGTSDNAAHSRAAHIPFPQFNMLQLVVLAALGPSVSVCLCVSVSLVFLSASLPLCLSCLSASLPLCLSASLPVKPSGTPLLWNAIGSHQFAAACVAGTTGYAPGLDCRGSQTYTLQLQLPGPFVGVAHSLDFKLFHVGLPAFDELKNFVETGSLAALIDVLQHQVGRPVGDIALSIAQAQAQDLSGTDSPTDVLANITVVEVHVTVDELHPFVSILSAITGSPDWFLAINSHDFCDHSIGQWKALTRTSLFFSLSLLSLLSPLSSSLLSPLSTLLSLSPLSFLSPPLSSLSPLSFLSSLLLSSLSSLFHSLFFHSLFLALLFRASVHPLRCGQQQPDQLFISGHPHRPQQWHSAVQLLCPNDLPGLPEPLGHLRCLPAQGQPHKEALHRARLVPCVLPQPHHPRQHPSLPCRGRAPLP
jgi:hypothetical protein